MVINNAVELMSILSKLIPQAMDNAMQRLVTGLKQVIDEEVYSYPYPNGDWFGRTGEFGKSWESTVPQMVAKDWWESRVTNEDYKFSWNNDDGEWAHGNGWSPLTNTELDEIINQRNGGSNFGFPSLQRDYWGSWKTWLDQNFEKIFAEEFNKAGIPIEYGMSFYGFQ